MRLEHELKKIIQTEWHAIYKRICREPGVPRYVVIETEDGGIVREFITLRAAEKWLEKMEE